MAGVALACGPAYDFSNMLEDSSIAATSTVWALDDEPEVIASLGALLEDAGFRFRGFTESNALLEAFEKGSDADLVLVDLNLPTLSGVEVIRILREHPSGANLPIVVLTAMSSEGSLLNAFEAGADDVVRKPYSLSELLARLTWQLSRTEKLRKLQRKNADLVLLTRLAQTMSRETSLAPVLHALADGVSEALEGARADFYLANRDNDLVLVESDVTEAAGADEKRLEFRSVPRAREALAARKRVTFEREEASHFAQAVWHDPDCRSAALLPLSLGDLFVGAMVVTLRAGRVDAARESYLLSIVADFAAVAIHRSRLFRSVVQESARIDEANRELARTRDFLSNVIDSSPDAIVVSDQRGRIVVFNAAAEAILGIPRAEAIGSDVRKLYPERGAERVKRMLVSDKWGGSGRLESRRIDVLDSDGERVPVLISASLLDDDEGSATVGVFTDIRSQIRMEKQLQAATESLERTRRQALIAELAGAAAHEINQPLTSLLGYAELVDSRLDDDDPNRRAFDTIYREAQRIADIVRKIGRITQYKTKEYVGGARIVDLDASDDPPDWGGESLDEDTDAIERSDASTQAQPGFDRSSETDEVTRETKAVPPRDGEELP